jgi:hypothetical protein
MGVFFSPGQNPAYDAAVAQREQKRHAQLERVEEKHEAERERIALRVRLIAEQTELERLRKRNEQAALRLKQRAEKLLAAHKQALAEQRAKVDELKRKLSSEDDRRRDRQHALECRREAEATGAKTYLTGLACRNGHVAPRYVSSGACVECDAMYGSPGYTKRRQLKQVT